MSGDKRLEILGLAGSPRRQGNSEALLDRALDGAIEAGAKVTKLVLNELNFVACQNCGYCSQTGQCRFKDDMVLIYEALDRAERIVLASPIYFTNVSAQTKKMVDRCQPYYARKYILPTLGGTAGAHSEPSDQSGGTGSGGAPRSLKQPPLKPGRRGLFLSVGGFKKGAKFFDCASFLVKIWLLNLDVELAAKLFYPGVDGFGEILKRPDALAESFAAGKALAT